MRGTWQPAPGPPRRQTLTTTAATALAQRYLAALEAGDPDAIAALFAPGGIVVSPLYGRRPARDFYATLGGVTQNSRTTLKRVLATEPPERTLAFHFDYAWTLAGGEVVDFEVVDIVELAPGSDLIAVLTILYDTAPLRRAHEAAAARSG